MTVTSFAIPETVERLEDLVARYQAGEVTALDRLMVKLYPIVFRFVFRLTAPRSKRERQEDLVQTCLESICRTLHEFEHRSQLTTYVYGICHRVVSNHRRSERVRALFLRWVETKEEALSSDRPDAIAEARQDLSHVQARLERLDHQERDSFVLHDLDGLALEDVAGILRCSTRTVKRRLSTARVKIIGENP